jgi:DNA mismatch repair protein MutL
MRIRRLSESTINRIAAGEVIERPASVVKELVENALDAGATQIDVVFRGGGKSLIRVSDNGHGMQADDLALAIERHATSKLSDETLTEIATLGFRGEALPSIGSVSRLAIVSRSDMDAHQLNVEAGRKSDVGPAARTRGTDVEVRDLFFATPARLKFLKTDRSETAEALDVVRRLALAHEAIGFSFADEERCWLDAPPGETREARVARIVAAEFMENAVPVSHRGEDVVIKGYVGLPTFSRAQGTQQFAFVNGRPVKDKLITGAIRGAYADLMPRGRFPVVVLFITAAGQRVDVNVHPAKTEVRFRDSGFVRSLIVSAIKRALEARAVQSNSSLNAETASSFRPQSNWQPNWQPMQNYTTTPGFGETRQAAFEMQAPPAMRAATPQADTHQSTEQISDHPLGAARAQIHGNYIVAQTQRGLVLVDQHAAHERLVYEKLKRQRETLGIARQALLIPQVVELDAGSIATLLAHTELLSAAGLMLEGFGEGAVLVREVPAELGSDHIPALLRDIADDASELGHISTIDERLNHVLATFACHHSVRSGRTLREEEMNALLREMEITPNAGECNHGRPTFIELSLADIEKLFGRR